MTTNDNTPLPYRAKLAEALRVASEHRTGGRAPSSDELEELVEAGRWALHAIPGSLDFIDFTLQHPINQVYFRAGLLACREYMARFIEQGGDASTAGSVRANWWPRLGTDPGAPRLFEFDEVAEEIEHDGRAEWRSKDIAVNVEALPIAYQFLLPVSAPPASEDLET